MYNLFCVAITSVPDEFKIKKIHRLLSKSYFSFLIQFFVLFFDFIIFYFDFIKPFYFPLIILV